MSTTFTIREVSVNDLDRVAPLFDAYRQFYRKPSDPRLAAAFLWQRLVRKESVIFLAVEEDGSGVGFTQLFPSFSSLAAERIFVLNDLFVMPGERRKGIGTALLQAARHYAEAQGAVRLTLSTEATNKSAQTLYEAHGWKLDTDYLVYTLPLGSSL